MMSPSLKSSSYYNGGDGDQTSSYDVFLSFRGKDTRHGFTDHLYRKLDNVGISVFRDKERLPVGERNGPELVKAIEDSKISVVIISPNYASSEWCLNELVQILKCKKMHDQLVIPIFYRITPSEIRKQSGDLEKMIHQKPDLNELLVQEWKDALMEVSYLTGYESQKVADGYEGELVEIVVAEILKALKKHTLIVSDELVGVENHVEKITEMLIVQGRDDNRAILIHGMGGMGKTSLGKVLFNRLSGQFKHCCYLANIREASLQYKGREKLQRQIITNMLGEKWPHDISSVDEGSNIIRDISKGKEALFLLDDVNDRDELSALVGKGTWFRRGSKFIITSRNRDILDKWEGGSCLYELNGLNSSQSLELFNKYAFKKDLFISHEYNTIAEEIVSTTGGLPLAIEVIGSHLSGKTKDIWEETLDMLKEIPHHKVQDQLKISYDALQWEEKQIFLDMACFSFPDKKNRKGLFYMWDSCGFHPRSGIDKLMSLSLIKNGENENLIIHDQLRDLGREIVRQESVDDPGKRSRIWKDEEAWEVMKTKQGTPEVKTLNLSSYGEVWCTSEHFKGMANLRRLHLFNVHLEGDFKNHFQKLRWLSWEPGYTIQKKLDIMGININPRLLVILDLDNANITEHWKGWSQLKDLKVLKLKWCEDLTASPDFSTMRKLEVLILKDCRNLRKIHPSIGKLAKTLQVLDVRGCVELRELPKEVGRMEELREFLLDRSGIREIPISEGSMTKLETLSAEDCKELACIPESTGQLKLLTKLGLKSTAVTQLPYSIGDLYSLEKLHIAFNPISCIPTSTGMLSKLQELDLRGCVKIESLPELPCSLTSLKFSGDSMETLPRMSNLTNLKYLVLLYKDVSGRRNRALHLGNLNQLETLQIVHSQHVLSDSSDSDSEEEIDGATENFSLHLELPVSLVELEVYGYQTLHIHPNLSNLKNLSRLRLQKCSELIQINDLERVDTSTDSPIVSCKKLSKLGGLGIPVKNMKLKSLDALELPSSLVELEVRGCQTLQTLLNLSNLKNLSTLYLKECSKLVEINYLAGAESLKYLHITRCRKLTNLNGVGISVITMELEFLDALESLSHLQTAKRLKDLFIRKCTSLVEIQGLGSVEGLQRMEINGCCSLERIEDLSRLRMLTELRFLDCDKLCNVHGFEKLTSMISLSFNGCYPMIKFPNLSMLRELKQLVIKDEELKEILGLQELKSLEDLCISGCKSLQYLPDFSQLTNLTNLSITECKNLTELQGLEHLTSLRTLDIGGCTALRNLPDMSNVIVMKHGSESTKSEDTVEESCLGCPILGCFPYSQILRLLLSFLGPILRLLLTHIKTEKRGNFTNLSRSTNLNDILASEDCPVRQRLVSISPT